MLLCLHAEKVYAESCLVCGGWLPAFRCVIGQRPEDKKSSRSEQDDRAVLRFDDVAYAYADGNAFDKDYVLVLQSNPEKRFRSQRGHEQIARPP
jgi:hypothetical protein